MNRSSASPGAPAGYSGGLGFDSEARLAGRGLSSDLSAMNQHASRRHIALLLGLAGATGCAETAAPPPAPEEIVVVLNSAAATLSLLPVIAPTQVSTIPLGASDVQPVSVSARGGTAVVALHGRDAIAQV